MPRRHDSLLALSRDHHDALTLAFRLQHPSPPHPATAVTPASTPTDRARWVLDHFDRSLRSHFRAEDEALFPVLERHLPVDAPQRAVIATLRREHQQLTDMRNAIASTTDDATLVPLLAQFGAILEPHVRAEERQLFVHFAAWLADDAARAVGERITVILTTRTAPAN